MPVWEVKARATSKIARKFDEADLRLRVRKVGYSGQELVRRVGDDEWVPLHSTAIFREEATGAANAADTAALARARHSAFQRFLAFMFAGVAAGGATAIAGAVGAPPPVVGAVGALSLGMIVAGWAAGMALAVKHGSRPKKVLVSAPPPEMEHALDAAVVQLEKALETAPESMRATIHVGEVKAGVAAMHRKRELLRALTSTAESRQTLKAELATAKECLEKAIDSASKDAFADEVRSIEGLLESLDRLESASAEADARERAMVNEIDALRYAVVQSSIAGTRDDEMVERLATLRRQIEDEAKIEKDLTKGHLRARALGPQKN